MKKTRIWKAITAVILMMVFAVGCNKPDEPNNGGNNGNNDNDVRVTTYFPQDITATTAKCGGDAIVTQGLSLTEIGVCWSKEQNPNADQVHLSTSVWNEPFVCTITDLEPDTKYFIRAYALRGLVYYYGDEKSFKTLEDYEYVDLGLPSGTLWATCNIGAIAPEDSGDVFAWGEIQSREYPNISGWSNYKYCQGDYNQLTKYCTSSEFGYNGFTDDLVVLESMDDAASFNWSEEWCIPTKEQWGELIQNTTNEWTTINGVNGRLFTSSNGNSLFLPGVGIPIEKECIRDSYPGFYWSSSLYTDNNYESSWKAWSLLFNTDQIKMINWPRHSASRIRPVRSR